MIIIRNVFIIGGLALFASCKTVDKAVLCASLKEAQFSKVSDSLSVPCDFPLYVFNKLHEYRKERIIETILQLKIRDGYVCTIDKFGGGYSGTGGFGIIWSKDEEVSYDYDMMFKTFRIEENAEYDIPVDFTFLFKKAIMQWDLSQIEKFYTFNEVVEPGCYMASRVLIRKGKVVNIQAYFWHG